MDNSDLSDADFHNSLIDRTSSHSKVQRSKSNGYESKRMSPGTVQKQVGGMLTRFLHTSSKHNKASSQESSGDSGETCNRLTDDEQGAELDAVVGHFSPGNNSGASLLEGHPMRRSTNDSCESTHRPITPTGARVLKPISQVSSSVFVSTRNLLASAVPGVARRRFSSDGSLASSGRRGSNGSSVLPWDSKSELMEEEEDHETMMAKLQKRGEDMTMCGELELAIGFWKQSLELAQSHKDTLATRTEIMCVLMDLHFQQSMKKRSQSEDNGDGFESSGKLRSSSSSMHSLITNSMHSVMTDEDLTAQPRPRTAFYHERQAKKYSHRIKPALVMPSWIRCNKDLVAFLSHAEAWELALLVAKEVQKDVAPYMEPPIDYQQLASLHIQVASLKLDSQKQGEGLQHLQETIRCLQQVPKERRDMIMYTHALQLLATEYQQQGSTVLAIEAYDELLKHAATEDQANICCQMAEIYISQGKLDMALEKLESAARKMDDDEGSTGVIRLQLLQTKGDVLYRLGRMDASMMIYQQALQEAKSPADQAKVLYTLGRLCIRLRRTREAITCFTRELEITKHELGANHLSVSHIYHELAKLYDEGLGEQKMALMKYNKALQIELAVLQECHIAVSICQKCNPVAHRMCDLHSNMHSQVTGQIRETKKCQGRMHFKLGDFDKALRTSFFNEQVPTGTRKTMR
jgi:tetratricopeptide (TPR) repeat protein